MKFTKIIFFTTLPLFLASCIGTKVASNSDKNDMMIHQLRVELEEIKHHIHTTVVQMNILTNKMVNSEDVMLELKQKELITQKQLLEHNKELLGDLEKKVHTLIENERKQDLAYKTMEDEIKVHSRALHQNKKKLHEIEKETIALKSSSEE
ncbi:hypothetical protein K0U07_03885 [bacterium]|nr:hypothetical protein [bacterium]